MTGYHASFVHMSQMCFMKGVGATEWDMKTWDLDKIRVGCLLRIAQNSDWLSKMAILAVPLHLAHLIVPYLSGVDQTGSCWLLAQRFLEEEGRRCGIFCPSSVESKVGYRMGGQLRKGRRLRLPPVTIFKARTKARETYRAWLKVT